MAGKPFDLCQALFVGDEEMDGVAGFGRGSEVDALGRTREEASIVSRGMNEGDFHVWLEAELLPQGRAWRAGGGHGLVTRLRVRLRRPPSLSKVDVPVSTR